MTVPGVNVIVAAQLRGRDRRHRPLRQPAQARRLLGSGPAGAPVRAAARPATAGSPSRARSAPATRWWRRAGARSANPGRCTRSISASALAAGTRSPSSPARASSRACSGSCSPASEDYAYAQPSLTRKKLRQLELAAGAQRYAPEAAGVWHANEAVREAERELARQAEIAYQRTSATTTPPRRRPRRARARHRDAHLQAVKAASSAAGPQSQTLRFSSSSPAPTPQLCPRSTQQVQTPLTFIRRPKHACAADRQGRLLSGESRSGPREIPMPAERVVPMHSLGTIGSWSTALRVLNQSSRAAPRPLQLLTRCDRRRAGFTTRAARVAVLRPITRREL